MIVRPNSFLAFLAPLLAAGPASATMFLIPGPGEIREDYRTDWAGFSTIHGALVSQDSFSAPIPTTDLGKVVYLYGSDSSVTIWNSSGRQQSGVLLDNSGPGAVSFYPDSAIQAVATTIESGTAGPVTYTINGYRGDGSYIDGRSLTVPDGTTPTFLGLLDPEAEIRIVAIISSASGQFTISDVSVQLRRVIDTSADTLPAAGEETVSVAPLATYLHQGVVDRRSDPYRAHAFAGETPNVHDLLAWFPDLKAGDILALERVGSSVSPGGSNNPLIGVISSTDELLEGRAYHRVPGALEAGVDFHTPPVPGPNGLLTPSNLQQDFIIGSRSLVFHPPGGRFLFLSRATQDPSSTPVSVRISHIPRDAFAAWLSQYGLVGAFADPDSDLDGDGLTLLEEFSFGKNPTAPDAAGRANYAFAPFAAPHSAANGLLQLYFGARIDAPIRYRAEVSTDLDRWDSLPDEALTPVLVDPENGRAMFSVVAPGSGPHRFGRVVIEPLSP